MWPKAGRLVADYGPDLSLVRPRLAGNRASSTRIGPGIGQIRPEVGQIWPDFGQILPAQIWPGIGRIPQIWPEMTQTSPESTKSGLSSAQIGPWGSGIISINILKRLLSSARQSHAADPPRRMRNAKVHRCGRTACCIHMMLCACKHAAYDGLAQVATYCGTSLKRGIGASVALRQSPGLLNAPR